MDQGFGGAGRGFRVLVYVTEVLERMSDHVNPSPHLNSLDTSTFLHLSREGGGD